MSVYIQWTSKRLKRSGQNFVWGLTWHQGGFWMIKILNICLHQNSTKCFVKLRDFFVLFNDVHNSSLVNSWFSATINFSILRLLYYSETHNNEYIGRIYQMSSSQFFNEFNTILRKFPHLRPWICGNSF